MLDEFIIFKKSGLVLFSWRAGESKIPVSSVNLLIDTALIEGHCVSSFTASKCSCYTKWKFDDHLSLFFVVIFTNEGSLSNATNFLERICSEFKQNNNGIFEIEQYNKAQVDIILLSCLNKTFQTDCADIVGRWKIDAQKTILNNKGKLQDLKDDQIKELNDNSDFVVKNRNSKEFRSNLDRFKGFRQNETQISIVHEFKKGWFSIFLESTSLCGLIGKRLLQDEDVVPVLKKLKNNLLEKNVASSSAEQICRSAHSVLLGSHVSVLESPGSVIRAVLRDALRQTLLPKKDINLMALIQSAKSNKRPYTIVFIGVNGVGKSTSLSKVANWLCENNFSVLVSACDTFRAGAVEQLRTHCQRLGVPLYERGYHKDPSVIAQGAIMQAKRQGIDVVLIDTAGRMQDNEPLMRALSKLINTNSPDLVLYVGEALVGNDSVDQLEKFNAALTDFDSKGRQHLIDGILISKFDTIDDKVGAALSMVHSSRAPIVFVGCGQTYQDLKVPSIDNLIDSLLS